jgi:hypothetical protein
MKKTLVFLGIAALAFLTACSNNPTSPSSNNNNTISNVTDSTSYQPLTHASTWTYTGAASYTVTVLGDTTVNGKSYRIIYNSGASGTGLVRKDGPIYYNFSPTGVPISGEFTGLNETPGSTWGYDLTSTPGTVTHYTFTNAAQGLTHNVLGKTYTKVIDVRLDYTYTFNGVPAGSGTGHYYYAQGIGLIEADLGALGGSQLVSYSIK